MTLSFLFPVEWPLWARRVFVLTLPISGPALVAVWALICAACGAIAVAAVICIALTWVITRIAAPVIWLWDICCGLWSEPPP